MAKNIDDIIEFDNKELFTIVGTSNDEAEKLDETPYSYWGETFKQLWKNPLTIVWIVILG